MDKLRGLIQWIAFLVAALGEQWAHERRRGRFLVRAYTGHRLKCKKSKV